MTELTDGQRIYAIGDVHGRLDLLTAMMDRISADLAVRPHDRPRIVMLGDYGDRGPDTRRVIDMLIALEAAPIPTTFLLGNHDSYIDAYLHDPAWFDRTYHWLHPSMGGDKTLASYGANGASERTPEATRDRFAAAFPAEHAAFLDRCVLWSRIGGYVFAHAGIRPGVTMEKQTRDDLIWIREPFLSSTQNYGFKVVHGHTIVPRVEHRANRIAVDTGAVRTDVLSCLLLEGPEVALLTDDGPRPWPQGSGVSGLGESMRSGVRKLWPAR